MTTPARLPEFSISSIAAFSSSGYVHRAFGHLVAAKPGSLLVVPLPLVTGDLRQVVDGCPVPWAEVWLLIDTDPLKPVALESSQVLATWPTLAKVAASGWVIDSLPFQINSRDVVRRISHPSGIRFAQV